MPTDHSIHRCNTLIIGAGIVGIAVAYYLKKYQPQLSVTLIDADQPMALTSAQSGENYRNWWPHSVMTAFTDHSIDLMEAIARESNNRIHMTRRGYVLATRSADPAQLLDELQTGYGENAEQLIRVHDTNNHRYQPADSADWQCAPTGVDVLKHQQLIRHYFPHYDDDIKTLIHIRRAGDIDSQQLGQYMLEAFKQAGGQRITGQVTAIAEQDGFRVILDNG
ncbi:MAG: NAD(P)/FAD-dependent oxidoreductase, partial [Thiolinea sp.]